MNNADVGTRATEALDFFIEADEQCLRQSWDLLMNRTVEVSATLS